MTRVTFIDTSILCELLQVPGKSQPSNAEVRAELERRAKKGERFVVPVTAVIETGNHIAQAKSGDRHAAATRLVDLLRAAMAGNRSFLLQAFSWDARFFGDLCDGNHTGKTFAELAGARMGAGDVAILVELDRFVEGSAFLHSDMDLWTEDHALSSYARHALGSPR